MICVSVLYPAAGEGRFDLDYYLTKHVPLCEKLFGPFGLSRIEIDEGLSGFAPGAPPNYRMIARLYFDSLEGFQSAAAEVGGQIFADVPNYTDIPLEVQISRLLKG